MNKNSQVSSVTFSLNTIKLYFLFINHIKNEFSRVWIEEENTSNWPMQYQVSTVPIIVKQLPTEHSSTRSEKYQL